MHCDNMKHNWLYDEKLPFLLFVSGKEYVDWMFIIVHMQQL